MWNHTTFPSKYKNGMQIKGNLHSRVSTVSFLRRKMQAFHAGVLIHKRKGDGEDAAVSSVVVVPLSLH